VIATRRRLLGLAAGLLLAGQGRSSRAQSTEATSAARLMDDLMWNRGPIGGPFALIDHTGKLRTDEDFRGKLLLIYFGYSYCPDVCPTDLQQIGLAVDGLGTGTHLADYVSAFHPRLIGLTGSAEQIRRVALAYKVYYAKYPPDSQDYVIDHSSFVYLVDKAGKYFGFFPSGTAAGRIIEMTTLHLSDRTKR
jgi:cytochrome oxidase Cu insertion factor (SCO1/SenC/PrrC family)